MYNQFIEYTNSNGLIDVSGPTLLGISGGVDSMVMLNLFIRSGYNVAVAHCNFGLRGDESDKDQLFVEKQCREHRIPFHSKRFNTTQYAREEGISVQMAARELRYSWFELILAENNYSNIGIAHNKNDLAETFFINLIRGTGIKGLTGIKPKAGNIIRPLLFAERKKIAEYARKYDISFREDSSNIEIKYKRNRIRHKIIPEFENISAVFIDNLYDTTNRLMDTEAIYNETVNKKFEETCIKSGDGYKISIDRLLSLDPLPAYLFEFLRRWNFPREIIPGIIRALKKTPGKQFFSSSHRLVKDRDFLLINPLGGDTINRYYIEEETSEMRYPLKLKITKTYNHRGFEIPITTGVACLDMDLIYFPLILRKWQKGDYFQPFGMKGLKKISDFFIDNKFSIVQKENTWLLASGNKIVWIAGHRIDERFKVREDTRNIILIEMTDLKPEN